MPLSYAEAVVQTLLRVRRGRLETASTNATSEKGACKGMHRRAAEEGGSVVRMPAGVPHAAQEGVLPPAIFGTSRHHQRERRKKGLIGVWQLKALGGPRARAGGLLLIFSQFTMMSTPRSFARLAATRTSVSTVAPPREAQV